MIDLINAAIKAVSVVLAQLIGLLPASPLVVPSAAFTTVHGYAGWAAWMLPLSEAVTVITALLAAILLWYGVRLVMRIFRTVAG